MHVRRRKKRARIYRKPFFPLIILIILRSPADLSWPSIIEEPGCSANHLQLCSNMPTMTKSTTRETNWFAFRTLPALDPIGLTLDLPVLLRPTHTHEEHGGAVHRRPVYVLCLRVILFGTGKKRKCELLRAISFRYLDLATYTIIGR